MNAMNNWLAKQGPPRHDRIDMQRIIVAGKFGEGSLIIE